MSYADMKAIDRAIEHRIMVFITRSPDRCFHLDSIFNYFRPEGIQRLVVLEDIPGWGLLGEVKRNNRVNKVIRSLVKEGRARLIGRDDKELCIDLPHPRGFGGGPRLVPLNALDRIVYALDQEGS